MIMKIPPLIHSLLWLVLLLLLFHEFYNFQILQKSPYSNISSSLLSHQPLTTHRKALASKFDFTPFLHHHRKLPPDHHMPPPPGDGEIDPRLGVEKRLIPTGPNPLHH
ncbi:hypothetical protein AAHA92_00097 [Salvia divinorum]|uniref:Uncharacterized protein n=1 Tax=Salvia divinorum TaxID=28513 RepID=A0ABD1IL69_SALDI